MTPAQKQEIFNLTYQHALQMTEKASIIGQGGDSQCAYRTPDGNKCLIGAVIKDDFYFDEFDTEPYVAGQREVMEAVYKSLNWEPDGYYHSTFMSELQACHDEANSPEAFKQDMMNNLNKFATKYKLEIPNG